MLPFPARPLLVLAAATLIPRALVAMTLGAVGEPERWEYDVIAANVADGKGHVYDRLGFVYVAYAPPLWSYVLAGLSTLTSGARLGIQVLQALFCYGAAVACGTLARTISGQERVGVLAGLLVALQPSLLYYSVMKSDPLALNTFLLALIAITGTALATRPTDRRAAAFGLLVGLAVLSRGTPVVALPLAAVLLLARWKHAALRPIAVATVVCGVCLAPWLLRNVALIGAPVLTSTTGENFWRGNHAGAGGGVLDLDGGEITKLTPENAALPGSIRAVLAQGTELDRHDVFMAEAWRFIRAEPGAAAYLWVRKMRTFWWRIDSNPRDYPRTATIAYEIIYRFELFLAVLGLIALFRSAPSGATLPGRMAAVSALGLTLAISLLQCAFYVQGRHRFLIEPLLLTFSAAGLARLQGWFSDRITSRPGAR